MTRRWMWRRLWKVVEVSAAQIRCQFRLELVLELEH